MSDTCAIVARVDAVRRAALVLVEHPDADMAAFGAALLVATVVGSGIMGDRLAGGNVALALLANTIATGAALRTALANRDPKALVELEQQVKALSQPPSATIAEPKL